MKKTVILSLSGVVFIVLLAIFIWEWGFCRFYVPPKHMAVVTAKEGRTPAPGAILVKEGEKGIQEQVLAEGRHFRDPWSYDVKIVPAVDIPIGKVGIVTSKIGKPLAEGAILAPDRESRGVWRNVLGPGTYRFNPEGYDIAIADVINIPVGYVGVVTSQTGKPAKPGDFARLGEKGVFRDILQPGLYYINPRAYQVNVIEIGMNQVTVSGDSGSQIETKNNITSANENLNDMSFNTLSGQQAQRLNYARSNRQMSVSTNRSLTGFSNAAPAAAAGHMDAKKLNRRGLRPNAPLPQQTVSNAPQQAAADIVYSINSRVEFPSRDGFAIRLDMTVEFELMPEHISKIYMLYGDLPQVVEKIILPQVLSVSRLKGSSYKAQDFILGEGRETFQNNLKSELTNVLREKSILVHNAIIRSVDIPLNILEPIRQSSIAREQNLTNQSLQETSKIQAELNSQTAMIAQKGSEVEQETQKLVAEINANRDQSVRLIQADAELEAAKIQLQRAEIEAKTNRLRGETEVQAKFLAANERALGMRMKSEVLGKAGVLSDLKLIENLNPAMKLRIIYAGEGTLWTDLKSGTIQMK